MTNFEILTTVFIVTGIVVTILIDQLMNSLHLKIIIFEWNAVILPTTTGAGTCISEYECGTDKNK